MRGLKILSTGRNKTLRKPGPELHSSSKPVSPNQEASSQSHRLRVRRPLLRHWVLRCKLFRRKSNYFACSDIFCARARAMHFSSTTFMLSPCAAHFSLRCILLRCRVGVCARPRAKKGCQKMLLVVQRATWFPKTGFPKH